MSGYVYSQRLVVKSFEEKPDDISARIYERLDYNQTPCALMKVISVVDELEFEGNLIEPVEPKTSEYWLYMSAGSKRLKIRHKGDYPIEIVFSDYNIKSLEKSTTYILVLATSVSDMSQKSYMRGYRYYQNGNISDALPLVLEAANMDNSSAQLLLGCFYYNGEGVNQDLGKAYFYFKKSADKGNVLAQFNLAQCYLRGSGVTANPREAVRRFSVISETYPYASSMLGNCYVLGWGDEQDFSKAKKYYKYASEHGDNAGYYGLGYCYYNGLEVRQSDSKAFEYYKKASENGFIPATAMLGVLYYTGRGVSQNLNVAFKYFRKAAEAGLPSAQAMLGVCYFNGLGTPRNVDLAKEWLTKAKESGNKNALNVLEFIDTEK